MQFVVDRSFDISKPDSDLDRATSLMVLNLLTAFNILRAVAKRSAPHEPSNRIDATPTDRTTEVRTFQNDSGWFHPVHLQLLHAGPGGVQRTWLCLPLPEH